MTQNLWYKNSIIYSLDIETYMDYNSDGIGDFEGLTRCLDYLHNLGVDIIWLAPFQPTPNRDNGYDVSDYYGVDSRLGSSGNFVEFMYHAKKRGFKVIIDLVVNHTSDEHPWFQQARSDKKSRFRDWYVWSKKKPADGDSGIIFPGVQMTTWTYDRKAKEYYFHRFYDFQPDLNITNPKVREEIWRIIAYWLELGVSGFRLDAVPFLLETLKNNSTKDPVIRFEFLSEIRRFLQWHKGDAIMIGEANTSPDLAEKYFGKDGEGIHLMFNFYVNQYIFYALATGDIEPLKDALEATRIKNPYSQWVHFLRNHDELDLGRLSEEQRKKVFDRFGPDEHMQLYGRGIRRRLSTMLGNRQQIELANSLIFSLPGIPVIRYGDEIGIGDDLSLKERNAVRTPMHWSADYQAGFSDAEKLVRPVIDEGPYSYQHVNAESQRRQPDSLLNWMTTLIRLRHACTEIGTGDWKIIKTGIPTVLGMLYRWQDSSLVILHNFADKAHEVVLHISELKHIPLINLMENQDCIPDAGKHRITIKAYGYVWFRSGDISHQLHRSL